MQTNRKATSPLLALGAVQRTQGPDIPGEYSPSLHVWAIDTPDGLQPLVNAATTIAELASKTETTTERDDPGSAALLETVTKTMAKMERDDQDLPLFALELLTKTFVQREREDNVPGCYE